jgi:hypothetical protein
MSGKKKAPATNTLSGQSNFVSNRDPLGVDVAQTFRYRLPSFAQTNPYNSDGTGTSRDSPLKNRGSCRIFAEGRDENFVGFTGCALGIDVKTAQACA